jgi:hypothetical protein
MERELFEQVKRTPRPFLVGMKCTVREYDVIRQQANGNISAFVRNAIRFYLEKTGKAA